MKTIQPENHEFTKDVFRAEVWNSQILFNIACLFWNKANNIRLHTPIKFKRILVDLSLIGNRLRKISASIWREKFHFHADSFQHIAVASSEIATKSSFLDHYWPSLHDFLSNLFFEWVESESYYTLVNETQAPTMSLQRRSCRLFITSTQLISGACQGLKISIHFQNLAVFV